VTGSATLKDKRQTDFLYAISMFKGSNIRKLYINYSEWGLDMVSITGWFNG